MRKWLSILVLLCAIGISDSRSAQAGGGSRVGKTENRQVDLSHAVILISSDAEPVVRKAAQMFSEETAKRSGVTLKIVTQIPTPGTAIIRLNTPNRTPGGGGSNKLEILAEEGRMAAEGYALTVRRLDDKPFVSAEGYDPLGCMFAVGYLLRQMHYSPGKISAPEMNVISAPSKPLRGHQLGYRVQSNTYDKWKLKEFEQYVRDLIPWGTNAIELIPYFPDTDAPLSEDLTVELAEMIHSYGLQVWLWFPFNDKTPAGMTGDGLTPGVTACPSRKDGRTFLLNRRKTLFQRMKYLDAVFIPGGDPGGCECELCGPWEHTFLPLSADTAAVLKQYHPHAKLWLSNQMFSNEENQHFHEYLSKENPDWFAGLVYSPWAGETCKSARESLPQRFALRMYPDITHSVRCQFTIPDWDQAFACTLDREPPLYRPTQTSQIVKNYLSLTNGAITYSDGVNDDLNKALWSALLWTPDADLHQLLVEYGNLYFGSDIAEKVAEGILAIEKNSQGPLKDNLNVQRTYTLWNTLDQGAKPERKQNWRFQMTLLRACFDLYVQRKLRADLNTEQKVYAALLPHSQDAVQAGLQVLKDAEAKQVEPELREKLLSLGQALYDSIGMQLSVKRWGASGEERGAILDHLDTPLANQGWLKAELTRLSEKRQREEIREGIDRIVNWENPGPGGFYDDLGNPQKQPHLVHTKRWAEDPDSMASPRCDFRVTSPTGRQSWNNYAEALYDSPLMLHYDQLDPNAEYSVRVTYSGRFNPVMTLTANDHYPVHGAVSTTNPPAQQEWQVPKEATASGKLTLMWKRVSGRGCQVAEVWLIKRSSR
jgi:hypothetical protein